MEKEKVIFFLDYANIDRTAREKGCQLDYADLLQYVSEARALIDAHCYVPINPRNEHRRDREIEGLWRSGYIVTSKKGSIAGGTYKCNFDVEITMDILKVVYQVKPDIIVLATGDSDFVSLIQEVRKSGVRVEVAAFEETAGEEILRKCSGFIDLAVYFESYLSAQQSETSEERMDEQYKKLIHAQNGEPVEDSLDEEQDLSRPDKHEKDEDDVQGSDAADIETDVLGLDDLDELDSKPLIS